MLDKDYKKRKLQTNIPQKYRSKSSRYCFRKIKEYIKRMVCQDQVRFETSLVVQWLRHHAPNAGSPGLIPGQGTRSHMHHQEFTYHSYRSCMLQLKIR